MMDFEALANKAIDGIRATVDVISVKEAIEKGYKEGREGGYSQGRKDMKKECIEVVERRGKEIGGAIQPKQTIEEIKKL